LRVLGPERGHSRRFNLLQRLLVDPRSAPVLLHALPRRLQDIRQIQLVIQGVETAGRLALRGLVELRLEFGRSVFGSVSLIDTHRTDPLSLLGPAAGPSLGTGCV